MATGSATSTCICANFGVDSSSRFPFIARTHRHTESQMQLLTLSTARRRGNCCAQLQGEVLSTATITCTSKTRQRDVDSSYPDIHESIPITVAFRRLCSPVSLCLSFCACLYRCMHARVSRCRDAHYDVV